MKRARFTPAIPLDGAALPGALFACGQQSKVADGQVRKSGLEIFCSWRQGNQTVSRAKAGAWERPDLPPGSHKDPMLVQSQMQLGGKRCEHPAAQPIA